MKARVERGSPFVWAPLFTPRWWLQEFGLVVAVCAPIVLWKWAFWGQPFTFALVYTVVSGVIIATMVEVGRYQVSRWRALRNPDDELARDHWPGWPFFGPWLVFCAVLGRALADWGLSHWYPKLQISLGRVEWAYTLLFVIGVLLAAALLLWHAHSMDRMQRERAAAQTLAAAARLKQLEAQIEPHMLFNTLANLRALIESDPPRAQTMLDHLEQFLRSSLRAGRAPLHTLEEEFARIEDYLSLMSVRMADRLAVDITLDPLCRDAMVPPLLFQPLVENAIKHGLEPSREGGTIRVVARVVDDMLETTVSDQRPHAHTPLRVVKGTGTGLQLVRERLQASFGDQARLHCELNAQGHEARVTLPLRRAAAAAT